MLFVSWCGTWLSLLALGGVDLLSSRALPAVFSFDARNFNRPSCFSWRRRRRRRCHRHCHRYWARSTFGWSSFSKARPNDAHVALAALEAAGKVGGVITQVSATGNAIFFISFYFSACYRRPTVVALTTAGACLGP